MPGPPIHLDLQTPTHDGASVELSDGQSAVIGRAPTTRPRPEDDGGAEPRLVTIASPNVSANHLRVIHRGDALALVELGSRNGTWLRLPAHREVVVSSTAGPVALQLAPAFGPPLADAGPADAEWTSSEDYAPRLVDALLSWLERRQLPSRIEVVESDANSPREVVRVPLATGRDLVLEPRGTVAGAWRDALRDVQHYVHRQNLRFESEKSLRDEGLIVASPAVRRAVAQVVDAAARGARALLITGPTGAGKEGLAHCFHRHTRRPGPFVSRNCALFSRELARAELFGAERGAFTGADARIVGAVEEANEGTLFLDELGELPREVQAMLLRFLDRGQYDRLGRPKSLDADVRVVCATNRDLRAASMADAFRPDLWFRLSVHVVDVPGLRDRPEDVAAYLRQRRRPDGTALADSLPAESRALLAGHDWQGNFRELMNFAERLDVAAPRGPISPEAARMALAAGALRPLPEPREIRSEPARTESLAGCWQRALSAFADDHRGAAPRTWDEVKDLIENYLKPVAFAELSGAAAEALLEHVDLRAAAERLDSDRGTAGKQLRRYFDGFGARPH